MAGTCRHAHGQTGGDTMKIVVLGAGVVGTASAWYLRQAGHEVIVLERQAGVARETSFANGGQISVSHAEPWANPATPLKLIKWLGQDEAPLMYRMHPDWLQWRWCLHFLRECTSARTRSNMRQIVALADYSRRELGRLRDELRLQYEQRQCGILHFYTDTREYERSLAAAQVMRELGCPRESITRDQVLAIEPALAPIASKIVGGDYTATDESGDVYQFTSELHAHAVRAGVQFHFNAEVTRLHTQERGAARRLNGVEYIKGTGQHRVIEADAFVVALGSHATRMVKPLGLDLLIYPGKGYSVTFQITEPNAAPKVSLTDDGHKLVMSRFGDRLRVAGTCELNGYSRTLDPVRCAMITRRTRELFPEACDYEHPDYWTGLRPLTPSNVPYIGATTISNLYLNCGHGTLGWTMACGSGKALADLVNGRIPEPDFDFSRARSA